MKLNLERPLLFFDMESTGLGVATDCIVELSFVKIMPDGEERIKTWRICPWDYGANGGKGAQKPMSPGASKINHIYDADLAGKPRFQDIAEELRGWLTDCDLAGFNSAKFDLPLLAEEIERVERYTGKVLNIDLHKKKMIDVQNIYHEMEPRNLKAAYRFYCGAELEDAHAAEADTVATYEVLKAQLDRYPDKLKNDVNILAEKFGKQNNVDFAGRLAKDDKGEVIITFGKHKGKTAREVYLTERSYFSWIDQGEFTLDTKRQFKELAKQFEEEKRKDAADKKREHFEKREKENPNYNKPLDADQTKTACYELKKHFGDVNDREKDEKDGGKGEGKQGTLF